MLKRRNTGCGRGAMGSLLASAAAVILAAAAPAAAEESYVLTPEMINASSVLYEEGYDYGTYNMYDQDLSTAWFEGAEGIGYDEWLEFYYPAGTVVTGGIIYPGYFKSEELFYMNGAPTSLQISSGNVVSYVDCLDVAMSYIPDFQGLEFWFAEPIVSDGVIRVTLNGAREGFTYQDTGISELWFYGYTPAEEPEPEPEPEPAPQDISNSLSSGEAKDENQLSGGVQQEQIISADKITSALRGNMTSIAGNACKKHLNWELPAVSTITAEDLTPEDMAFVLYWYQYSCKDSRVQKETDCNKASMTDLRQILVELFGQKTEEALQAFMSGYADGIEGDQVRMNNVGDFGDAGLYIFSIAEKAVIVDEDGKKADSGSRVKINGIMKAYDPESDGYVDSMAYTAYFYANKPSYGGQPLTLRFDSVSLEELENKTGEKAEEKTAARTGEKTEEKAEEKSGKTTSDKKEEKTEAKSDNKTDQPSADLNDGYTIEELAKMAQDHYEKTEGYRPQKVEWTGNEDGTWTLHLFDVVNDHNVTIAWLTVDAAGKAVDEIMGTTFNLAESTK